MNDTQKGEKALLFLHGYLETMYIWEEFAVLLPDSFRCIFIDIPGHGLTGTHPESNTMDFCARVCKEVLDKLELKSAVIVGHSMGGYIGQACLKLYPERFSALVHFNSTPYADIPEKAGDRQKEIGFIENGKLISLASIAVCNMYSKDNVDRFKSKIEETVTLCETHDPSGIIACIRGLMDRPDNTAFLKSLKEKVMFVFGDQDKHCPLEKIAQIRKDVPSARFEIVPGTGHNSFIEEPQKLAEALLDFVNIGNC